ncbi:MAG TPA: hypothetical protein VGZ47_01710 [Gemmataceae bacterium]|nr:hypothetical protein [Gemmataceae bacterium]
MNDEQTWFTGNDLAAMKRLACVSFAERKLRLFGCACCRRIWPLLNRKKLRQAIEVAERFADGLASDEERERAYRSVAKSIQYFDLDSTQGQEELHAAVYILSNSNFAGNHAPEMALDAVAAAHRHQPSIREAEARAQMNLLRDIFGPLLFRWIRFADEWHEWKHGCLRKLARTIYEDERFDLLPILSDALQEAGCTDAELLAHCHAKTPHVRGCWVVDWILGRN